MLTPAAVAVTARRALSEGRLLAQAPDTAFLASGAGERSPAYVMGDYRCPIGWALPQDAVATLAVDEELNVAPLDEALADLGVSAEHLPVLRLTQALHDAWTARRPLGIRDVALMLLHANDNGPPRPPGLLAELRERPVTERDFAIWLDSLGGALLHAA